MLNAGYDFRRNNAGLLVNPDKASAGWSNLGRGLQVAGGIMSWKAAKDRADKLNKAQEDYYDALTNYLNNNEVGKSQKDQIEDEELYSQLEDLPEDEASSYERLYNTEEGNNKRKQYLDVMDTFLQMYGGK
jgi:hypothetical protein